MEQSTIDCEWGQKEAPILKISIYEPDESGMSRPYATVILDKNLSVSYHISNTGERYIHVKTSIMNPVLWNIILIPNNRYYYKIVAEDTVRELTGKDFTMRTEYGSFPVIEANWTVDADGTPVIYEINFRKNQPYHWAV